MEQSKICVCVKFVVYYTLSLKKQKPLGMPGRRGALPCRTRRGTPRGAGRAGRETGGAPGGLTTKKQNGNFWDKVPPERKVGQ